MASRERGGRHPSQGIFFQAASKQELLDQQYAHCALQNLPQLSMRGSSTDPRTISKTSLVSPRLPELPTPTRAAIGIVSPVLRASPLFASSSESGGPGLVG